MSTTTDTNNNDASDLTSLAKSIAPLGLGDTSAAPSLLCREHQLLWHPSESRSVDQSSTQLQHFTRLIEHKFNVSLPTYDALYAWSVANYVQFWEEFWHFARIRHSRAYTCVLADASDGGQRRRVDDLPFKWFDAATLNYAENLLLLGERDDQHVAVYSYGECFPNGVRRVTFGELRARVGRYQRALRRAGVRKGDRVVGYMPNVVETLEAMLAVASLGAVWSCASPDFGSASVVDRFSQIEPRVLFSVTAVTYNGKSYEHKTKLKEVINGLPSLEKVVIVPFNQPTLTDLDDIPKQIALDEFLALGDQDADADAEQTLHFEQVAFDHPLVILYSSGTTGSPKCIVHSHGGTLIQHLKEHMLMSDLKPHDVIFYYTTTGWMMYNWLVTSLAVGASIVLYDGSPVLPTINVLWDLTDQLGITMFGTSAKWLSVIEENGAVPKNTNKLDSLKVIFSTGSPLKPTSFDYVYAKIKSDLVLGSITGGSDIISLFCGHNVSLPVYREEIQCRQLAMAVECWNERGEHAFDECGELVCTKPFPSMPVYFYNDPDFVKYKSSYFNKFPGVWAHGDYCMISSRTGGCFMFGRSDGTLNPNGVRFGSADIYNALAHCEEISDSLCVGQRNPTNPEEERVVLFVQLKPNVTFEKSLADKIKSQIRTHLSPRHVPNIVLPIDEIPYTLNMKKVEVPVRRIIEGVNVTISASSLANPNALEQFRHIASLKQW